MIKSILKLTLPGLLAIAIAGVSITTHAQTNAPAAEKKSKRSVTPFHGKLKSVDNTAKSISVGETTIQITSETKIDKGGKPATLGDGVVGEDVSGGYKKDADGKLSATTVHFGPKAGKAEMKKEEPKPQ